MLDFVMRQSGVYAIRHIATGRCYVGSSVAIPYRWRQHRKQLSQGRHHSRHLQRAWDKYGPNAFEFAVLELVEPSKLIEREQYHIDLTGAANRDRGFNILVRAGTTLGSKLKPCSEERKRKIGAANSGKSPGALTRAKQAAAKRGRVLSPKVCERMAEAQRARRAAEKAARSPKPDTRRWQWLAKDKIDEMVQLYESGLTTREVGDRLGVSAVTVSYRLRQRGVVARPAWGSRWKARRAG